MLQTNKEKTVKLLIECRPAPPRSMTLQAQEGQKMSIWPSFGGIVLNVVVGDSAVGYAGEQLEPAVSCLTVAERGSVTSGDAMQSLVCVGNRAVIVSGYAEGVEGVVTGIHPGRGHVMIDFPENGMAKLTYRDKIIVNARGQGLLLTDYPDVKLCSLDPDLLAKLVVEEKDGKIQVGVAATVPAASIAAAEGEEAEPLGVCDIMSSDAEGVGQDGLETLRLGDFVALIDYDLLTAPEVTNGAVTLGIVIHGESRQAGRGPGVMALMSCSGETIQPVVVEKANIADMLSIGRTR